MKLTKKNEKPIVKTVIWVVEKSQEGDKRKQFTCYNTTLEEIEELLYSKFKGK